eukprot:gnl/TRDRNA2_/TRDRNA2_168722_c2_seq1.p1 gnl/TRDRNA2_/TRDRNA2_168722_c2~~gnl/TRDRNA2_/TRDRNA2_168722_c2_seq1.p1  ORF type:complete len:475 (-),score=117.09 gnl/TRDRNA2_/TRDRNA2_168722_c2_seq1:113-1537(-)
MSIHLTVKKFRSAGSSAPATEFPVDIDASATVEELKEQVAPKVELTKENIRLVCAGRVWDNTATIGSYSPNHGAVVHCLSNPGRAAPVNQTLQPANPMAPMGDMSATSASNDPMEQMMSQAQRQMMQNPEMMQQLMSSPMVQQMMSDPETMRAMVRMNPRLNQLMEQRPEIARMLEDPELLQQSMRLVANPSLMREMTRNADRAIGQLDAMPGGHNALRRAHEEFVDPLYAAMSASDADGLRNANTAYTQDAQTQGGPNTEALPNPWGARAATASTPASAATGTGVNAQSAGLGAQSSPFGGANPFGSLFQQQSGMGTNAQGYNPYLAMMQQMSSQQPQPAQVPSTQQQSNPFSAMMQQMQSNPQMMQQMMAMSQQMGQQPLPGGYPNAAAGQSVSPAPPAPPSPTSPEEAAQASRIRFASQLDSLSAMGFTDEALCLQALQRHDGRLDAAIDMLLAAPSRESSTAVEAPTSER